MPKYDLPRKDYQQKSKPTSFSSILPVKPTLVGFTSEQGYPQFQKLTNICDNKNSEGNNISLDMELDDSYTIYQDYINKAQFTLLMQVGPMMLVQLF